MNEYANITGQGRARVLNSRRIVCPRTSTVIENCVEHRPGEASEIVESITMATVGQVTIMAWNRHGEARP